MPRPSNTEFNGVHFSRSRGRFKTTVINPHSDGQLGTCVHGGYFKTAKEAALAYDRLAIELYGNPQDVPRLNFPLEAGLPENWRAKRLWKRKRLHKDGRRTGNVYVIRLVRELPNRIKVGFTGRSVAVRLKAYLTYNPTARAIATWPGTVRDERRLRNLARVLCVRKVGAEVFDVDDARKFCRACAVVMSTNLQ